MIATIALAALVSFPGGTTNDLTKFLRDNTNKDTLICRGIAADKLVAVDFDPSTSDGMNSVFRPKYDLRIIPGNDPIFSDERIPSALLAGLRRTASPIYVGSGPVIPSTPFVKKQLPADAIQGGKITFHTDGKEVLDMNSLMTANLGKPFTMNWVYLEAAPAMDVRDSTVSIFLDKLAKSVGGRLHETDKGYSLDFQPSEFRRRATRTLNEVKGDSSPQGQLLASKAKLAAAALQAFSDQNLTIMFASPGGRATIAITTNDGIAGPANNYLLALEASPTGNPNADTSDGGATADTTVAQAPNRRQRGGPSGGGNNQARQIASALQSVDPNRTATLTMTSTFQVQIDIPIVDRNGRSSGTVRFGG